MTGDWLKWPGLAGARGGRLVVQRAAFGKADRARTDYRWLAASAGWVPSQERLERRLALGGEDRSVPCPLWRHERDQWLAVMCMPSRARDFEGRPTPLEKHMLRSSVVPDVTPAMAAFTLFEFLVGLGSDEWFHSYDQPQWQQADYQLQLDESAPLEARLDYLAPRVDEGLTGLQSATTQADLALFYAQVLTPGVPPALLRLTSEMPLGPFSLAALLLPLAPSEYSFAGGIPSSIFPTEDEIQGWTGLVVQAHVQRVPASTAIADDARRLGEELAAALWVRDPGLLSQTYTHAVASSGALVTSPSDGATPTVAEAPVRLPGLTAEPSDAARSEFLSFVRSQRYEIRPGELRHQRSHDDFADWAGAVLEFKTIVLDMLDALEKRPVPNDLFERYKLESERDEFRVKAEIGRAWLIGLLPRMALLDVIGRPRDSDDEGPLSFAVHFDAKRWNSCRDFSIDLIDDFIRRTKRGAEITRLVDQWTRDAGITP